MGNESLRKRSDERVILTGSLKTVTALHVGSGYGSARTDATVVRDAWGNPFIPGSSFKGALRSTIERMLGGLGVKELYSCQLTEREDSRCLSMKRKWQEEYRTLQERMTGRNIGEDRLVEFLEGEKGVCATCRLFGSAYSQSRVLVKDLPWLAGANPDDEKRGDIRHGVGIDRDTLTARDQIKFDFEALPSQLTFAVELVLERPSPLDLALLAVGLQEMIHGFVPLGGMRSRGLGRCELALTSIQRVDLSSKTDVLAWLRGTPPVIAATPEQAEKAKLFVEEALKTLETALTDTGATHVSPMPQ